MKDRSENERRAALRRSLRGATRASERKRWEWERRIASSYGLTPEDVARKWHEQRGRCPICGADLNTKVWVIDHDHKSGRFRGLLCAWCNHRIVAMAERGGYYRARAVIIYLWPGACEDF